MSTIILTDNQKFDGHNLHKHTMQQNVKKWFNSRSVVKSNYTARSAWAHGSRLGRDEPRRISDRIRGCYGSGGSQGSICVQGNEVLCMIGREWG